MVDPKTGDKPTVETSASAEARKVWVKPRLETIDIADDTLSGPTPTTPDGAATSIS
jgi:hypothetical protein